MNQGKLLTCLIIALLFLLLHVPFFEWWCNTGLAQFLMKIQSSCFNDCVVLVTLCIGSGATIVISNCLSEIGNRWCRTFIEFFLFVLIVESIDFSENFIHFFTLPWFRYTDILIPIFVIFWIKSYFKSGKVGRNDDSPENLEQGLFFDNLNEADFLNRNDLVIDLCKRLMEDAKNVNGAAGIEIVGGWGSGKSWVMSQIQQHLEKDGEICIEFKPWLYGDANITRMFYQRLESQLKLNGLIIEELNQAITEIDNDEFVGFGRAFLSLFGIITKREGREQTVRQIKDSLKSYNKQIYIFIDDCDRLAKKELLQVLGLIRNTGDFPNLTYILAYDKEVIKEIVGDEPGLDYVGKIINLPINLPPIDDNVISGFLYETVCEVIGFKKISTNPYVSISITDYIPTVREAKRYLNLLITDYRRYQERLEKFISNEADFCLVELLKYKYPDLYYKLRASPQSFMTLSNNGWNGPVWVPNENCTGNDKTALRLLNAMFKITYDSQDHYGMVSIANNEYFPLYFEGDLYNRYVEADEFNIAIESETFPQKISKWMNEGRSGVLGLLSIAQGYLSRKDVFLAMTEYIWHQCEIGKAVNNLDQLMLGYDKLHYKHSYKNISWLIHEAPQIHLITFQNIICDENKSDVNNTELINGIGLSLELMGIWMNELRLINNLAYPYSEVKQCVDMLWKKLTMDIKNSEFDTLNIIDIWGDSTTDDTFKTMVLPLVTENPQRWLGASIMVLKDGNRCYYILKSNVIQAIFGDKESLYKEMKLIVSNAKEENKEYVNTYAKLLYRMADILVLNDDPMIDEQYKEPEGLEVSNFASLEMSELIGMKPVKPLGVAIGELCNTFFWKGGNIRIHRES